MILCGWQDIKISSCSCLRPPLSVQRQNVWLTSCVGTFIPCFAVKWKLVLIVPFVWNVINVWLEHSGNVLYWRFWIGCDNSTGLQIMNLWTIFSRQTWQNMEDCHEMRLSVGIYLSLFLCICGMAATVLSGIHVVCFKELDKKSSLIVCVWGMWIGVCVWCVHVWMHLNKP